MPDEDSAVVELRSHATASNGMRFDDHYCWVIRFAGETIVEVRPYLDSALVKKLIDANDGNRGPERRGLAHGLALLQLVADLPQEHHVCWILGRGWRRLGAQLVDPLHHHEDDER